jgi:hypothetical protein
MTTAQKQINEICSDINRRIYSMNYEKESAVRDYLSDQIVDDKLLLFEGDSIRIADILEVNEKCIFDVLTDADLLIL